MIIKAGIESIETVLNLAVKLYADSSYNSLQKEFQQILLNDEKAVFLYNVAEKTIGFAYCSLRYDYVEGSSSSPVGYLEGIYIDEKYRKKGYAKELVKECEKWSINNNCSEFASDCQLDNIDSKLFHEKTGFKIAGEIICFIKNI